MNETLRFHLARLLIKWDLPRTLAAAKLFPTDMTPQSQLDALIKKLHPVAHPQKLIRLGPDGDGGYLVPDDLAGIQACFSPGVSCVSGFENDCAELGMNVFLADKSVEGPATSHELFHFTKKFLGAWSNDDFMTLDDWVTSSIPDSTSDLLLQIDIEGYEYETLLSASDALMRRFRVIVGEFHSLDQLWNRPFFNIASRVFEKILETHRCVHIHPNNCCGALFNNGHAIPRLMEFTFVRKDRLDENPTYRHDFPHPLDCDNTGNPSLPLPSYWYSQA